MKHRVVVTGIGIVSPLGRGADENWRQLVSSAPVTFQPPPRGSVARGPASLLNGDRGPGLQPAGKANYEVGRGLAKQAASDALFSAGLWDGAQLQGADPDRFGCTFSASKPLFDGSTWQPPDRVHETVRTHFGLTGEARNVVAACATGPYAAAMGASWIEQGLCDVVLTGSVEPPVHPLIEAGFRQMGVVSPDGVTQPFDAQRRGFSFGAGAGAVVLESAEHAVRRGHSPMARLTGWGLGSDDHSPVAFNSNGRHIASVILQALRRADLPPERIGHVNAHGTATPLNDRIETQALHQAFGVQAKRLQISATKASTGHLLGAAGSVEFVLTVLAVQRQFVPPTATLSQPDPQCDLDYTAGQGHPASFDHALSLSFGFGGPIGALVVSRS